MDEPQNPQEQAQSAQPSPAVAPTSAQPSTPSPQKKSFFKSKGFLFGLIGLVVVGLIAVGAFVILPLSGGSSGEEEAVVTSDVVETLTAEQLGLSIEAKPDGKAVKIKIEKAGDIKNIEYQLTYEADSTAQERAEGGEERVQRGVTGEADVESGALTYESEWLDLGSCSRNVCKYDAGVESIDLTLKLVKKNGKTYEAETTQSLVK